MPSDEHPPEPDEPSPYGAPPLEDPEPSGPTGRELIEPPGYELVSFLATVGLVIGIGMAVEGLLLAAAAVVLSIIESRELLRLNPWIAPKDGGPTPFSAKPVMRLLRYSFLTTLLASVVAYLTVDLSGNWLAAVPPAVLAGIVNLALNHQLKVLLAQQPDR